MKTKFAVAAVLFAAACGGGGSDVDAQLTRIDSRPTIDSVIIPAGCTLEATIAEPPDPTPDTGNTAVLRTATTATPPEEIYLWNYVVAGTGTNPDLFQFIVPYDAAQPAGQTVPPADFNTALPLVEACTAAQDFCMVGLGDFDLNTGMEAQFFYPNTGTATITEAGEANAGNFVVTMTASRFDQYTMPGGDIVDENADGTPDCSGTVAAFPAVTIPVTLPTIAPQPGEEHYGKFGKYTRR